MRIEHTKKTDPEIANLVRELVFKMPVWCMSVHFGNDFLKSGECSGVLLGFRLGVELFEFVFLLAVYSNLAEVAGLIGVCIWEHLNWGIVRFNGRMENLCKL